MKITMNMSNYEIEQETVKVEYGDEILFAGWNPEIDTSCQQLQRTSTTDTQNIPASVTAEVVEQLLRKMYLYQR